MAVSRSQGQNDVGLVLDMRGQLYSCNVVSEALSFHSMSAQTTAIGCPDVKHTTGITSRYALTDYNHLMTTSILLLAHHVPRFLHPRSPIHSLRGALVVVSG